MSTDYSTSTDLPESVREAVRTCLRAGTGEVEAAQALSEITEPKLRCLVGGTLVDRPERLLAVGKSRAPGIASGVLTLSTRLAQELEELGLPYVLAIENADVTHFPAIRGCAGFLTETPAQTAFGPVQAVSHGKPTLIDIAYQRVEAGSEAPDELLLPDGRTARLSGRPSYAAVFRTEDGTEKRVPEGTWVSLDAVTGRVYEGDVDAVLSPVAEFYTLAWSVIEGAVASGQTETYVGALRSFGTLKKPEDTAQRLRQLADDAVLRGYARILAEAHRKSKLDVWATSHTPDSIGRAQLMLSRLHLSGPEVTFEVGEVHVGLMRDERMWANEAEQDVLRLLILGPDVVRDDEWQNLAQAYLDVHTARLTRVLAEARGGRVILRTLCMPYAKIFSADRDIHRLLGRCKVSEAELRAIFAGYREMEMYQGCRGMRLLCQRPDLARLWLTAVFQATRRVAESGEATKLRILLPTITLPEEARRFLKELDEVAPEVLGEAALPALDGVSIMIETTGAYLLANEFLSLRSQVTAVDGGMFGSNDFTAACFSVNREDSTRTIFPGYVQAGILPASPFDGLDLNLVGRAIIDVLDRTAGGRHLIGLGGELAGEWGSVMWLADEAAARGFGYVTSGQETVLRSLFASVGAAAYSEPGRLVAAL